MIRTGEVAQAIQTLEGYTAFNQKIVDGRMRLAAVDAGSGVLTRGAVDISWLPLAAEQYRISADINDYVICDIPIVHVDIPNRNLDAFPFDEVSRFDPGLGRVVYQSFIGKPTHIDHDNKVHAKAKGVIFDASMAREDNGCYTIRILAGFDRSKDRVLAEQILSGKRPGHSMGAMVNLTACSICGMSSTTGRIRCSHMEGNIGKGRVINGQLCYEACYGVQYIESSSVEDPADHLANQAYAK